MKHYLFSLLLLPVISCCQSLTNTQIQIVQLELTQLKETHRSQCYNNIIGDSLLVYKDVIINFDSAIYLSEYTVMSEQLKQEEANDIFGTDTGKIFYQMPATDIKEWKTEYFPDFKVAFATVKNQRISPMCNPLSLSIPCVRSDGKYALLYCTSESIGGLLKIYKNNNSAWALHKQIILFAI
ncbi:MAG: hypothetical protein V4581_10120 [Bacteroidota bacterium]